MKTIIVNFKNKNEYKFSSLKKFILYAHTNEIQILAKSVETFLHLLPCEANAKTKRLVCHVCTYIIRIQ